MNDTRSIKKKMDIYLNYIKLAIHVFDDDNFALLKDGVELESYADKNDMIIYLLKGEKRKTTNFYKHEIARRFLLKGIGNYVIYKDGDFKNLKVTNLKRCNRSEYRDFMLELSNKYIEKPEKNKEKSNEDNALPSKETFYKITLPDNSRISLPKSVSIEEKISIVDSLVNEWSEHINKGWQSSEIKIFLSSLSNYLVWHKDDDDKFTEDKEVLSIYKLKSMDGKIKNRLEPLKEGDEYEYE